MTYKKIMKYFSSHPVYTAGIYFLIGAGAGILLTYPFVGVHPIRWGVGLMVLGLLGIAYPMATKK